MKILAHALAAILATSALCSTVWAAAAADFAFRSYTDANGTTPYRLYVPRNYDPTHSYPVVLFLHGAGEVGTNNVSQLNNNANGALVFVQGPNGPSDTAYETA